MKYLTSFMIAYIHISKYDRFDESKKKKKKLSNLTKIGWPDAKKIHGLGYGIDF